MLRTTRVSPSRATRERGDEVAVTIDLIDDDWSSS